MLHSLRLTVSSRLNRMGAVLFGLGLAIVSTAQAQLQPTLRVGANTQLVGTGAVRLVYGGGALTNNGSLSLTAGQFLVAGPTTYGGAGSATVATTVFNHTGNSTLSSLLSVTDQATLAANTSLNANGQLYLRTDGFPNANLVNNGILTGTVQGLVTNATAKLGGAGFMSTLSTNVSGSSMAYQWQSSADNSQFSNVSGAVSANYTASVSQTTYYRCLLTTTNSAYSQTTPAVQLVVQPPANTAPVATNNANQTATVGVAFSYTVNAFSDAETPNSLTYTASIDPANGLSFDPATRIISGTPSTNGVSTVTVSATDPGNLSASTTFTITVSPAPVTPTGPFAITGVTTVNCSPIQPNRFSVSFTPRYQGDNGSPVSFSVVSELLPTIQPGPYTLQLYADNPRITLKATQSGVSSSFVYDWLAACNTSTAPNTPPRVAMGIPAQTATVGSYFSYVIAEGTFTDAETPASLRLSAAGVPVGLSFTGVTLSGTPLTTVGSPVSLTITATDPGGLRASTELVLTVQPAPGTPPPTMPFSITGVTTISCTPVADRISISFAPRYAGMSGEAIAFEVVNETLPTTEPAPYSLTLYRDNPVITLRATQTGSPGPVTFSYNWLAACSSLGQENTPPRLNEPVQPQSATVGVGYSLNLTTTFADQETPNQITLTSSALPAGLTLSGKFISGTPSVMGVTSVTLTATDGGGLSTSTSFTLTVSPASTTPTPPPTAAFSLTGVTTVSCEVMSAGQRRVTFTPRYAGESGSPISFSVVNELAPTTSPGPYSLTLYTDNPVITLSAKQGGVSSQFSYGWLSACNPKARVGAAAEVPLRVTVLGNPVLGETVEVEVGGAEGQALTLRLTDERGYPVSDQSVRRAGVVERQRVSLGRQPAGVLLLQVSTSTQSQTVKLLKAE